HIGCHIIKPSIAVAIRVTDADPTCALANLGVPFAEHERVARPVGDVLHFLAPAFHEHSMGIRGRLMIVSRPAVGHVVAYRWLPITPASGSCSEPATEMAHAVYIPVGV